MTTPPTSIEGGKGAVKLAEAVLRVVEKSAGKKLKYLYELDDSLPLKIGKLAKLLYGADDVVFDSQAEDDLKLLNANGYGKLKDQTFRISHMGGIRVQDLDELYAAIDAYLAA